jgi:hypothetical protein
MAVSASLAQLAREQRDEHRKHRKEQQQLAARSGGGVSGVPAEAPRCRGPSEVHQRSGTYR